MRDQGLLIVLFIVKRFILGYVTCWLREVEEKGKLEEKDSLLTRKLIRDQGLLLYCL